MTSLIPKSKLGSSEMEACIVCGVLDTRVSRCCGAECVVWFHGECLVKSGVSDDLSSPFCPYCWLKLVTLKSKSLREEAIEAHKALLQYRALQDQETAMVDTCVDFSRVALNDGIDMEENEVVASKRVSIENSQDVEDVNKGDVSLAGKEHEHVLEKEKQSRRRKRVESNDDDTDSESGDMEVVASGEQKSVSKQDVEDDDETELYSGSEHDLVQQHEDQSGSSRRRGVVISDDDSEDEISASEEHNGQDVTEANNQPTREASFVEKGHKKRILWTPEEEENLKIGVEIFGAQARRNMPWRKILIWGEHVFDKDRRPSDLKDKWKNMSGKINKEQKEQNEQ